MNTYTIYDLGLGDYPSSDRKVATFYDRDLAIDYVYRVGVDGKRYAVYDADMNRVDEE